MGTCREGAVPGKEGEWEGKAEVRALHSCYLDTHV